MTYFFQNPLDLMPMVFDTQEQAESAARTYLGKEDGFCEIVTGISIYERTLVSTVTNEGPNRIKSTNP